MAAAIEESAEQEEGVINLSGAMHALAEGVAGDHPETNAKGLPQVVVVLASFEDGSFFTFASGPGYSPEAHMQLIGNAGNQLLNEMVKNAPEPSRILTPHH